MSSSLQTLTFMKYLRFWGLVFWFRRQRPGAGRKDRAATKGKTTSVSGFVYSIILTSAALGSDVVCYRLPELRISLNTLTDSRSSGRMVLARKMKSCLDVTILKFGWHHQNSRRFDKKECQFKTKNQSIST